MNFFSPQPGVFVQLVSEPIKQIILMEKVLRPLCSCKNAAFKSLANNAYLHTSDCMLHSVKTPADIDPDLWSSWLYAPCGPGVVPVSCLACGTLSELTIDHIIPQSFRGKDSKDNYRILCGQCNRARGSHISPKIWSTMSRSQKEAFVANLSSHIGRPACNAIALHLRSGGAFEDIYGMLFWFSWSGFSKAGWKVDYDIEVNQQTQAAL